MNVYDGLIALKVLAKEDRGLRGALLGTREAPNSVMEFCRIASDAGIDINAMDLVMVGEEEYAMMKRSTNGGGANSPMLDGEDDYYAMFLNELELMK